MITNTGITTGDLTVTGTCTGCTTEASYTNYALILNQTIPGTSNDDGLFLLVANDGSSIGVNQGKYITNIMINGTSSIPDQNVNIGSVYFAKSILDQSESGKYKISLFGNGTLSIFKNNSILQQITVDTTHSYFDSIVAVGISPNGKYIGIIGDDKGNSLEHIQIWSGS